jgi:tRNA nucleotidyltransferase (CCA-adding enzyme)
MWYGALMHGIRDIDKRMAATLASPGVQVYRVGGSVRDELLGRRPKDADYMVRGLPLAALALQVSKLGKISALKLRDGRAVGTRVHIAGHGLVEIALPRTEVSTGPGHRDFEIMADERLGVDQDALRRDLTINALYRDVVEGGVLDPTGRGMYDLENKLLNTTHPDSFRDDPLRALRALRFVSQLDFSLSKRTFNQMSEHSEAVHGLTDKGVSGTALDELCKLLMGKRPDRALRDGRDAGVLGVLLPELTPMFHFEQGSKYHDMTTDEHTFEALRVAAAMNLSLRVRLALLFHDSGKPEAAWVGDDGRKHYYATKRPYTGPHGGLHKAIVETTLDHEEVSARLAREALMRLNTPKRLRDDVIMLVRRHMVSVSGNTKATKVRRWRVELGDELLADLFKHRLADCMGKGAINYDHVQAIARLEKIREDAERLGVPTSPRELEIKGGDIAALGAQGPEIGKIQRKLLDEVVCQPDRNEKEWLLERAQRLLAKQH